MISLAAFPKPRNAHRERRSGPVVWVERRTHFKSIHQQPPGRQKYIPSRTFMMRLITPASTAMRPSNSVGKPFIDRLRRAENFLPTKLSPRPLVCVHSFAAPCHAIASQSIPIHNGKDSESLLHAHFPSRAIKPAPKHIHPKADKVMPMLLFRISTLNMNSCAMSSTRPV